MKTLLALLLLFVPITLAAQTNNDEAARRAMQMGHTIQQERVYLHFDNSAYYLGETMWFKAYVSYGNNDRTTTPSKVLYVELVAPEGYVVETKKYKLDDNGCCNGDFELKPLLLSGYYEVRAYTRYMLNWGKEAIFSRVFPIFDKVNGDNWDFKNMLDRKRGFARNGQWISQETSEPSLTFYPEGGNLVAGLTSTVAYELRGTDSEPIENTITIYEGDSTLLTTTPEHMGKGLFSLTPKSGVKYWAKTSIVNKKNKTKEYIFALPQAQDEGVVISTTQSNDEITFDIKSNITKNDTIKDIAFGILYRGAIGYYKKIGDTEKEKSFTLPLNELPEGVNKAIVFSGCVPLAERCFFVMHDTLQKNDRNTVKLKIESNNYKLEEVQFSPHERIIIDVKREDGKPIPASANLSIAVSDAAGKVTTSWSYNMYSYLLLGSEIKGYIPDAAQYFDPQNKNRKAHLDLVMLTNGWTAYDWEELTRGTRQHLQPIERGITLKGVFYRKNKSSFQFGKETKIDLIPQKDNLTRFDIAYDENIITNTFRTDSLGEFIIETEDFFGKRIAALSPQTILRQNDNIKYTFALDRYYSPSFRLYDYWERNTGKPLDTKEKERLDSLVQINPFAYMLSSVEIVGKAKESYLSRPPHSEMRFDFLDEWEYAQDITYLKEFESYKDGVYLLQEKELLEQLYEEANKNDKPIDFNIVSSPSGIIHGGNILEKDQVMYIGNVRYGGKDDPIPNLSAKEEYRNSLNAADVVSSAMHRHNYNWAYWVYLMVVAGEYDSNSTPRPDNEYLHGKADAEKMMNFKEFVIRSDEKTREQFENTSNFWVPKGERLDTYYPLQKFYMGFYSRHYVSTTPGIDGFPSYETFNAQLNTGLGTGISYPKNPNYVACFIPYTEEETSSRKGIIPDLANSNGTMRYTSIQGYNESKKFYSPDYSHAKPTERKDYRRTLLWSPSLQPSADGTLQIELYNSSVCNNINVEIAGRDGQTFYSNDHVTTTRISPKTAVTTKHDEEVKKEEDSYTSTPLDPEVEKACEKQNNFALIHYKQKRYRNAIMLWVELAKYGYTPAYRHIAQCYIDGTGVTKNLGYAKKYYEDAAKEGDATSQYELAIIYRNGIGCTPNEALAHTWMLRASKNSEPRAMASIAKYLINKGGDEELREANNLMIKAAQSGMPEGLYEYAMYIKEYPDAQKAEGVGDALECLRIAADNGVPDAQIYIMEYEYAAGNYTEAYNQARALSLAGRHEGTKRMADCYNNGQGVKRNKKLAKDLYRTAADAGNKEAAEILKNL